MKENENIGNGGNNRRKMAKAWRQQRRKLDKWHRQAYGVAALAKWQYGAIGKVKIWREKQACGAASWRQRVNSGAKTAYQ
jgi:hypothetical protein